MKQKNDCKIIFADISYSFLISAFLECLRNNYKFQLLNFNESRTEKYFEWVIMPFIGFKDVVGDH